MSVFCCNDTRCAYQLRVLLPTLIPFKYAYALIPFSILCPLQPWALHSPDAMSCGALWWAGMALSVEWLGVGLQGRDSMPGRAGILNLPARPYRIWDHQTGTVGPYPTEAYHALPLIECRRLEWAAQHLHATIRIQSVQCRALETNLYSHVTLQSCSTMNEPIPKLCNCLQYFQHLFLLFRPKLNSTKFSNGLH
jgi:hypothetical protein